MVDVARLAGVSQTTVSFVINGNPNIPDETREKVMAVVNELGYRPNTIAQSLRSKRTGIIGFITDEIAITPYAGKVFEGAQDAAWEQGKVLLLVNTKNDMTLQETALDMMFDRKVEGIIYATMFHHVARPPRRLWEMPSVLIGCFVEDRSLASVVPDEYQGGYKATMALLKKGHRRIGFINNVDTQPASILRLAGYRDALAVYGVGFDAALVCEDIAEADGGYRGVQALMQVPNPPTGLFCFNDRMAMGAYDALRKMGYSIPDDVSVVGFDNQEIIAAHLYPPLSTVELPHYEMGRWGVEYLLREMHNETGIPPLQHRIDGPFVSRCSI